MPLEVKKQGRETAQALVRRFGMRLRQSGILRRARDIRYWKRPKSAQAKKSAALRKEQLKKEFQKQKKLGKTPEPRRRRRR